MVSAQWFGQSVGVYSARVGSKMAFLHHFILLCEFLTKQMYIFFFQEMFQRRIVQAGSGVLSPVNGSRCRIKVTCDQKESDDVFTEIKVNEVSEITLGSWTCDAEGVIHQCVRNMVEDEVCEVTLESENKPRKRIEVMLLSYSKGKEVWEMSARERFDAASSLKCRGVELYKRGDIVSGFRHFTQAAKCLISMGPRNDICEQLQDKWQVLSAQVHLNMAACQTQTGYHEGVVENCSKALTFNGDSVKGYYRRAQSRFQMGELEKAKNDLVQAKQLEPGNTAVDRLLQSVESRLSARNSKMVEAMSKMFS